jgi:hypothetical protein
MYFKQQSVVFCLNYRALYIAAFLLLVYGRFLRLTRIPTFQQYGVPLDYTIHTWYVPTVTWSGAVILTIAACAHAWRRRDLKAIRGPRGQPLHV